MKVGLDVRISLVRVLSTGREAGEASPQMSHPTPKKKVFPEKKLKAISNTDLI